MYYVSFEQWRKLVGVMPVYFAYKKLDGSFRLAYGTKNFIVAKYKGFSEIENETTRYIGPNSYFDFDKRDWRCFSSRCNDEILLFENEEEFSNYNK